MIIAAPIGQGIRPTTSDPSKPAPFLPIAQQISPLPSSNLPGLRPPTSSTTTQTAASISTDAGDLAVLAATNTICGLRQQGFVDEQEIYSRTMAAVPGLTDEQYMRAFAQAQAACGAGVETLPPPKSKKWMWIAGGVIAVVVVGATVYYFTKSD